jgi:flavin reductase (DIM6/NTAB) family NADH-FMN oxidoreductase RutF
MAAEPARTPEAASADRAQTAAALRKGLRGLAKAVVVITCRSGEERFAMAATAVSELSMDPPSMLICVNRSASLYRPLSEGADFCINILRASQAEVSLQCSGKTKGEERFAVGDWRASALGAPRLQDGQASFACRNVRSIEYGTHAVFIGEVVEAFDCAAIDPLIYVDGRYGRVQPDAAR